MTRPAIRSSLGHDLSAHLGTHVGTHVGTQLRACVCASLCACLLALAAPTAKAQGTGAPTNASTATASTATTATGEASGAATLPAGTRPISDPALEARVHAISAELRCLVCQNQTVADSNAGLAVDLRNQVRTMLQRGESEAQVIAYMTARYGDFVLYRPPVRSSTWVLWYGPGLLLVGGLLALVWVLRRRSRLPDDQFDPDPDPELNEAEPDRHPNR